MKYKNTRTYSFPLVEAFEEIHKRKLIHQRRMKVICLVILFLAIVAIARVEADNHGVCGKYTPDRMLTHVLRHCEKPAKDLKASVTSKCCEPLSKISDKCFYAIINSDAWKHSGLNPKIALMSVNKNYTLDHMCLLVIG